MNNTIEVTGCDHGEPLVLNWNNVMWAMTATGAGLVNGPPKGARSQIFMFGGAVLNVKETLATIKQRLGVTSIGSPAPFVLPEPPGGADNNSEVRS